MDVIQTGFSQKENDVIINQTYTFSKLKRELCLGETKLSIIKDRETKCIESLNDYHKNNISIGRNLLHRNLYLKNTGRNCT